MTIKRTRFTTVNAPEKYGDTGALASMTEASINEVHDLLGLVQDGNIKLKQIEPENPVDGEIYLATDINGNRFIGIYNANESLWQYASLT